MKEQLKKLETIGESIIGVPVLCSILIVTIGVVSRCLGMPAGWTDETLQTLFVWLVFIVSAAAFRTDELIGLDLVEEMLKKKPRAHKILKLIHALIALIFVFFMLVQTYSITHVQYITHELTPVMSFPVWTKNLGYFLGFVLFSIFGVWKLFNCIRALKTKTE